MGLHTPRTWSKPGSPLETVGTWCRTHGRICGNRVIDATPFRPQSGGRAGASRRDRRLRGAPAARRRGPARGLRRRQPGGRRPRAGRLLPGDLGLARWCRRPGRERARPGHGTAARGIGAHRHPGALGWARRRGGGARRGRPRLHPPDGATLPARRHRLLGRLPRRGRRAVRRAARHHPLGPRPPAGRGVSRRSPSTPTRSTSATASTGRVPGSPPASISRWPWSRRTSVSTSPRPSPAGS